MKLHFAVSCLTSRSADFAYVPNVESNDRTAV